MGYIPGVKDQVTSPPSDPDGNNPIPVWDDDPPLTVTGVVTTIREGLLANTWTVTCRLDFFDGTDSESEQNIPLVPRQGTANTYDWTCTFDDLEPSAKQQVQATANVIDQNTSQNVCPPTLVVFWIKPAQ